MEPNDGFVPGHLYKRAELHQRYGGQRQGGIATPRQAPFVLIFTGESGAQFGYRDGWRDDGLFDYTGEGQIGDMQMVRGNAAIANHSLNGKELHAFETMNRGRARYIGEMVCVSWREEQRPDRDKRQRKAFVFELAPVQAAAASSDGTAPRAGRALDERWTMPLEQLHKQAREASKPQPKKSTSTRNVYERSEDVRIYVLRRANGVCEGCFMPAPFKTQDGRPYLEAHHIRRLSDGGPDDPEWVAGVCPNCHRRAHHASDRDLTNERLRNRLAGGA